MNVAVDPNPKYRVVQLDSEGDKLDEVHVVAANYNSALRGVDSLEPDTFRIVVFDPDGNKAGEAIAGYWRHSLRR